MRDGERYKCDRHGGTNRAPYMRRDPWICPQCDRTSTLAGHRCRHCRRRVCCPCFDHLDAVCRDKSEHGGRGIADCVAP